MDGFCHMSDYLGRGCTGSATHPTKTDFKKRFYLLQPTIFFLKKKPVKKFQSANHNLNIEMIWEGVPSCRRSKPDRAIKNS